MPISILFLNEPIHRLFCRIGTENKLFHCEELREKRVKEKIIIPHTLEIDVVFFLPRWIEIENDEIIGKDWMGMKKERERENRGFDHWSIKQIGF